MPNPSELKAMTRELESPLGIRIVTHSFYLGRFEIEVEENTIDLPRLPGIVAGHHAYWGSRGNVWGFTEHASPRKIILDPDTGVADDSEYILIHHGVKVSDRHRSTSCGVVIQNVNNGDLRLTVALHGWSETPGEIVDGCSKKKPKDMANRESAQGNVRALWLGSACCQ